MKRLVTSRKPWWSQRSKPEHLWVPDTQVKPGVRIEHLRWLGKYIAEQKPDVILRGNDWFDLPSLCFHDLDKADFLQRDLIGDLCAGAHGLDLMLAAARQAGKGYNPLWVFIEGNHDERWRRIYERDRRFKRGMPGPRDIVKKKIPGALWVPLEDIICIDGVHYSHYFINPMTGRPLGGTAQHKLTRLKFSYTMGHQQTKDPAEQYLANGEVIRGLVAGAFYLVPELRVEERSAFCYFYHGASASHPTAASSRTTSPSLVPSPVTLSVTAEVKSCAGRE